MAEKTVANATKNEVVNSVVVENNSVHTNGTNGTTPDKCTMLGCIAHRAGSSANRNTGALTRFVVHFRSQEEIMRHATESMSRVVAQKKRGGKDLPTDRVVDIYCDLSFSKTVDDEFERITKMNSEERIEYERELTLRYEAFMKLKNSQLVQ